MSSKNLIDLRNAGKKQPPPPPEPAPAQRQQRSFRLRPDHPASPRAISRRISPVRIRRQRTRFIIVGVVFALLAGIVYGIGWLSYLPRYTISDVKVVGTSVVPPKLVSDYVQTQLYNGVYSFLAHNNIFLYNPHAIEREIVGFFPRIEAATVSRESLLANAITVTVQERQPFALWCQMPESGGAITIDTCYQMDSTGFIFAQAPASDASTLAQAQTVLAASSSVDMGSSTPVSAVAPAGAAREYVFQGGLATSTASTTTILTSQSTHPIGNRFVGAHMPGIIALLQQLSQAGYAPVGADVDNSQDFRIPLSASQSVSSQGFYIKASFGEDPASIVSNLQLVLSADALAGKLDQLEYVDLRFGDRVYYKLRGSAQMQSTQH